MPWDMLADRSDWNRHCTGFLTANNMSPHQVVWGAGPVEYPCLVATMLVPAAAGGTAGMRSAYVYKADAVALLKMAGLSVPEPGAAAQVAGNATQNQFNRWVSAQMLTVIKFMVDTGICKPGQFEERMIESLEMVDAWKKDKTEELRAKLGPEGNYALQGFDPAEG